MISTQYNRMIAQMVNNNERLAISRESSNNRDEPVQHHEFSRYTNTLGEKIREAERLLPKPKQVKLNTKPVEGLVVGAGKSEVTTNVVEKVYKKQVPKVGGGMEIATVPEPKRVLGGAKKTVKGAKLLATSEDLVPKTKEAVANTEAPSISTTHAPKVQLGMEAVGGSAVETKSYSGLKWNDLVKAVCRDRKCAMKEAIAHIKANNLYNRPEA
jgi:hypothetical protein